MIVVSNTPPILNLSIEAGFWIKSDLYDKVLQVAGE